VRKLNRLITKIRCRTRGHDVVAIERAGSLTKYLCMNCGRVFVGSKYHGNALLPLDNDLQRVFDMEEEALKEGKK